MAEDTGTEETSDDTSTDTDVDTGTDLTPDQLQAELSRARREAAKYRNRVKQAEAEAQQLKEQGQSEAEKAVAKARDEGREEALRTANARIVSSAAIAAAAGKLANPRRAPQLIDLSDIEVDDEGNVDEKELDRRIADLLKTDPYLSADAEPKRGSGGLGARQQSTTTADPLERELRSKLGV